MATGSSTLVKVDSDGGLVLGTLAGDRATFATLYDRFAAPIYDLHLALLRDPALAAEASHQTFQRAVANLNHLGEPSQLRPWLYSMVYRQGKPSGASAAASGGPQSRPGEDPQAVIWRAVPELGRLDRALFTLHLRHGLDFSEIGTIVGMSADRARSRLDKLRARLDPALRPLLQSRLAPPRRPGGPPNRPPPSFDELLASHPTPLRVAVPLATPPAALRERVLREIPLITAHQGLPRPRTRAAWITTVATVLVIVMGTALFVHRNMERKPVVAVTFGPSSELSLSTTVIDLGATNSTSTVTLDNTGKNRLSWRTDPGAPWLKVQPPSGSLDGGQSQELTVVADRGALPQEGDGRTQLKVSAADGQGEAEVSVALREERPPAIINPRASSTRIGGFGCPTVATISATIRDESPPVRVVLVGPGQQSQPMQPSGETYSGRIGSGSGANVVWKIIATDSRNNTATSPAQVIANADCMARPSPKPLPSASARPSVSSRPSTGATGRSTAPDDTDSPGSTGRRTPSNGDDGDSPGSGSGRGEDPYGGGRFGF